MNRDKWIAVTVGIVVVGFFIYGGDAVNLFQQSNQGVGADINNADTTMNTNSNTDTNIPPQPGSLQVQDIQIGTGDVATVGSLVTVNYVGTLADGTKFDSSLDPGRTPFQFRLGAGQVIQGWEQGIVGMKVGGKRILVIPASLGYGAQQVGPIPPNSTLIFEVELLQVDK